MTNPLPKDEAVERGTGRNNIVKAVDTDDCWLYAGNIDTRGYGRIYQTYHGKIHAHAVHRLMYEACVGSIPEGLLINHLCEVKICVNPKHLEAVTNKQNIWYSMKFGDDRCARGHELTEDNVYISYPYKKTNTPHRKCKKCHAMTDRQRRIRNMKRKKELQNAN